MHRPDGQLTDHAIAASQHPPHPDCGRGQCWAMPMSRAYIAQEPTRDALDAMPGPVLLEFGAPWCPHCLAAEPLLDHALSGRDDITHLRIEDGRGRRLGRAFAVKLWPTFVLLQGGVEQARAVRPRSLREVQALFDDAEA